MLLRASAIIVAVRVHGEHGVIVRALTAEAGLLGGYVRGGRSRRLRPVLSPGNIIRGEWRARTEDQLASLVVELTESRAGLLAEPLAAAGLDWITALTAIALPEGHPYPQLHSALEGVLAAIVAAPSARGWAGAVAAYESLMLTVLGYGSGARPVDDSMAALRASGIRIGDDLLTGRRADVLASRERLIARLERAIGNGQLVDGVQPLAPKRII
jgi:DNA repair protein RecO (recombination protein O)